MSVALVAEVQEVGQDVKRVGGNNAPINEVQKNRKVLQ